VGKGFQWNETRTWLHNHSNCQEHSCKGTLHIQLLLMCCWRSWIELLTTVQLMSNRRTLPVKMWPNTLLLSMTSLPATVQNRLMLLWKTLDIRTFDIEGEFGHAVHNQGDFETNDKICPQNLSKIGQKCACQLELDLTAQQCTPWQVAKAVVKMGRSEGRIGDCSGLFGE